MNQFLDPPILTDRSNLSQSETVKVPRNENREARLLPAPPGRAVSPTISGSSSGRAALQARLDLIAARSSLDPYNAKTLGQYVLIGDPSIHPVVAPSVTHALAGM